MRGLDRWIVGRRAPLLAAALALVAALPGLIALPVIDRDEARFAQATVQMLESEDYTAIRFQDRLRGGAAPGPHWAQAISVQTLSTVEARTIWAYRLPSLLGVMLAAAACAWGATGLFGRRTGGLAGVVFASGLFAAGCGAIAGAHALFLGAAALALAAFGRIYAASREPEAFSAGIGTRLLFWTGVILGVLTSGPLMLALALLTGATLFAFDRRAPWLKTLGGGWGMIALFAIAGPWAVAVTIATDGDYWSPAAALDGQGAALTVQTLAAPLLLFPAAALLPLGAVFAWRHRRLAGVRLAAAWTVPAWVAFELSPDKLVHDAVPLYIGLVWLGVAAVTREWTAPRLTRRIGAGLSAVCGLLLAGLALTLAAKFGQGADMAMAVLVALLFLIAAGAGAVAALSPRSVAPLLLACGFAVLAQGASTGLLLPGLERLWPSREVLSALTRSGLDPRRGLALGPVASAGYAEPSLVFALGAPTETSGPKDAAIALDEGRPAIVEAREEAAFRSEAKKLRIKPYAAATVEGFDYPKARDVRLTIYSNPAGGSAEGSNRR